MSIDKCHFCEALVDTDNEPDSYVQMNLGGKAEWVCTCWDCRPEEEDDKTIEDWSRRVEEMIRKTWP